ncbi:MAG: hypothetical protein JSR17_00230 [Proteobacteria bacterium]|nr:hypothetical protein [Pseudomonadota bacterium]
MGDEKHLSIIRTSYLRDLQIQFQKEVTELIDIYLHDAKRKIANLHKALLDANYANYIGAVRELRLRSVDVGAIQFSYRCLQLEIAVQEMRLEFIKELTSLLESEFVAVQLALEHLKASKSQKGSYLIKEYS